MEKIVSIDAEATFGGSNKWENMDGVLIITTEQVIKMGIANGANCCEQWGYFLSADNPQDFVGAELLSVDLTDSGLNTSKLTEACPYGLDAGELLFVTLTTSKGILQFTAYNAHNGFYSHQALVESKQVSEDKYL